MCTGQRQVWRMLLYEIENTNVGPKLWDNSALQYLLVFYLNVCAMLFLCFDFIKLLFAFNLPF